jgi:hypothetical protein
LLYWYKSTNTDAASFRRQSRRCCAIFSCFTPRVTYSDVRLSALALLLRLQFQVFQRLMQAFLQSKIL